MVIGNTALYVFINMSARKVFAACDVFEYSLDEVDKLIEDGTIPATELEDSQWKVVRNCPIYFAEHVIAMCNDKQYEKTFNIVLSSGLRLRKVRR